MAFRLAVALADEVQKAVRQWPSFERWTLGIQLVRAAESIGANLAEAYGRWHRRDQRRQLYIARGSVYETEYWLTRAVAHGLVDPVVIDRAGEVGKTLGGLIRAHLRTD
jgi:four helix bundle protein